MPAFRGTSGQAVQDDGRLSVYLRHRAALVEYATPIVGDRMRAEDVVQEAYIRFVPGFSESATEPLTFEKPASYLYRIVRNLAYDLRRKMQADNRRDQAHLVLVESQPLAASPEEETVARDELRRVEAYLGELPPDVRRAFEMHRLGGYKLQEIAEHMGVSIATASRWTQDAIKHVLQRMERAERK